MVINIAHPLTNHLDQPAFVACFTPQQPCTKLLTELIYAAKKSVDVQAYSFTSYPIAHALKYVAAHGVAVKVIADKSNFAPGVYSKIPYLIKHHVPVWLDDKMHIAHNKVMIIDNHIVETGSFNYTSAAQWHNAENMLIIDSTTLAKIYLHNWLVRQSDAKPVTHYFTSKLYSESH